MTGQQPQPDKNTEWEEWVKGDLRQHMDRMLIMREVFLSWNDILGDTNHPPQVNGVFHTWVVENYIKGLAVAVRTACDDSKRSRSLLRLLGSVKRHHHFLTPAIEPSIIQNDIDQLLTLSAKVRQYVNMRVAHVGQRPPHYDGLSVENIHQAADRAYEIYHRWHERLCNVVLYPPTVTEVPRLPWEYGFTRAWITEEQAACITNRRKDEHMRRLRVLHHRHQDNGYG